MIEITSVLDPRIAMFCRLTEAQLRNRQNEDEGIFIAESPKVIDVALDAGLEPLALLCERRHLEGDAAGIIRRCEQAKNLDNARASTAERNKGDVAQEPFEVFTGSREVLAEITGYTLTRGVLCAMRRPALPTVEEVCRGASRIVVIDGVTDTTNTGAIFRSAAALGVDGVLLTRTSCDPLNRRAVRVSMGSVFLVPWTWLDGSVSSLRELGFRTAAMALTGESVTLDDQRLKAEEHLAIVMGTEGDGLARQVIAEADYTVRIPMHHSVDSLNVAAAAAVAFWELCPRRGEQ